MTEENIAQELKDKFGIAADKIRIPRKRRIFLDLEYGNFARIFDYAVKQLKFPALCAITGLDDGENLSFIYHLANEAGITLNIKTSLPKANPYLQSVITYFPCAEVYERELVDLFGAKVEGLPAGHRYPLTDDWPQGVFPLRKDFSASEGQVQENA